jgi:membrane protein implicated in regulation of membrane protease activity
MSHIYLGAVVFGVILLVASVALGGKDVDHGGGGHAHDDGAPGLAWLPFASLRFWIFLLAFGGATGWALEYLGESVVVAAGGAVGVGWLSGTLAVAIIRALTKRSVSSEVGARELVGTTGELVLPAGPGKPGKVRVDVKGRTEDFIAHVVEDSPELVTGTHVLVVAEGDPGALLVAKHEV